MRHNYKGRKLGTDFSHTKAMKKSLVGALFLNDRIKTVESRAKEIRPNVDKIITWAKRGDLHARRLAIAALGDKDLVREIFEKVSQGMFADRLGGYTRIMKLGSRKGDKAPMVIMELVTEPVKKSSDEKVTPKKVAKKTTPKKVAAKAEQGSASGEKQDSKTTENEAAEDVREQTKVSKATEQTDTDKPKVDDKAETAIEDGDKAQDHKKAEAKVETKPEGESKAAASETEPSQEAKDEKK